jgi:hypothetical protein
VASQAWVQLKEWRRWNKRPHEFRRYEWGRENGGLTSSSLRSETAETSHDPWQNPSMIKFSNYIIWMYDDYQKENKKPLASLVQWYRENFLQLSFMYFRNLNALLKFWKKKKKMSTTPGVPRRSPIQVLTRPNGAWLGRSDGMPYFHRGMVVPEILTRILFY